MNAEQIIINAIGLGLIGLIIWFFRQRRENTISASVDGGVQTIDITVKGGYQPASVKAKVGSTLRLNFMRREPSMCGEEVVLPDFGKREHLPEGETRTIEIRPEKAGVYEFACGMNMYRGKLIVE